MKLCTGRLLIIIVLLEPLYAFPQDILGGELSIVNLNSATRTYRIDFFLYTKAPSSISHNYVWINWGSGESGQLPLQSQTVITTDVTLNVFSSTHSYAGNGSYYLMIADSNFRVPGIVNMQNSATELFYYLKVLEINPFFGGNSSSTYLNYQTSIANINGVISHAAASLDPDGDSLSYSLVPCNTSGYTFPQTSSILTIDSLNGNFLWDHPLATGIYQFCIKTTEWRYGYAIGENIRDMVINVNSLAGINELISVPAISIYPNPTSGIFTLKSTCQPFNNSTITIFNSLGETILQSEIQDQKPEIDLSSYPTGVYFLKVDDGNKMAVKKIIKM